MPSYFQPINPYTPFQNQLQYQQPQSLYQSQVPQVNPGAQSNNSQGIIWVQGETGAKSYLVAPNQSVLLMDSESNTFYIKSSDTSGMPLPLRVFDYTERTSGQQTPSQESAIDPKKFVTHEEFEKFKNEVLNRKSQQNSKLIPKEGA